MGRPYTEWDEKNEKTEDNIIDLSNKDTVANLIMEAFDYIPGDEYL